MVGGARAVGFDGGDLKVRDTLQLMKRGPAKSPTTRWTSGASAAATKGSSTTSAIAIAGVASTRVRPLWDSLPSP